MNRNVFTFAVMAVVLSACAHHKGHERADTICAEPNTHCVKVTVVTAGGKSTLRAEPERLTVRGPSHVIFWQLENPPGQEYTFGERAIAFDTPEGQKQFSCIKLRPSLWRCLDPNTVKGEFKYTIRVSGSVPPYDPWVINE